MKKLLFFYMLCPLFGFAQSATLLPQAIELPKFASNPACTTTEKGRLIFNTTDNKSYYCNGSAWVDMSAGGLTLPFTGSNSIASPNSSFSVINTSSGRAIFGETQSAIGSLGVGIYGLASNTSPSVMNTGVTGYNASTNPFGIGVFGQHDGTGTGVYGVVKGAGTAVKGFATNLFGAVGDGIGVEGISTLSNGVRGTSNSGTAIYAESSSGRGLHAKSTSSTAVRAESSSGYGVYVTTGANNAGLFENNSSSSSTIFATNFGGGNAGRFSGNVVISGDIDISGNADIAGNSAISGNQTVSRTLTVQNGKGIMRSNNGTQLKTVLFSGGIDINSPGIAANSYIDLPLAYSGFSSPPHIAIASFDNETGDFHKIHYSPFNVGNSSATVRCFNTSSTAAIFSVTIKIIIIGPE